VRVDQIVDDYDFRATLLAVADLPPAVARRTSRILPMMNVGPSSVGSFGR